MSGAVVWRLSHANRRFREDEQFAFIGELCFGNVSKSFGAETWRWEAPVLVTEKNDLGWSTAYTKLHGDADSELVAKAACETAIRQHWRALDARELLASWMISHGYATGHGDSVEGLLGELGAQIERARGNGAGDAEIADLKSRIAVHERREELWRLDFPQTSVAMIKELREAKVDIARKDEALREMIERHVSGPWGTHNPEEDYFIVTSRAALHPLAREYNDDTVKRVLEAAARPPEAKFDNAEDMMKWLDDAAGSKSSSGWQSIDTAPKDGTSILLICRAWNKPDGERLVRLGFWDDMRSEWGCNSDWPPIQWCAVPPLAPDDVPPAPGSKGDAS